MAFPRWNSVKTVGRIFTLGVVVLVVASGIGAGAIPAAQASVGDAPVTSAPQDVSDSAASPNSTADQSDDRQFEFDIWNISTCGFTCRNVTITATNTGDEMAKDVTVQTQLETGDTVVWQGNESVSELDSGESKTMTKRVQVGLLDALSVKRNDGHVTANTTVTWNSGNETFTDEWKVT
ncbi:hypothetical protein C499_14880 [Halogeometricum borinquense DSM 11551]|uniref:Uncharacterized protein n=2 Tax=Halogeometricum borinquense TaxID=60847 RepID=E4NTV8_HALBP|nr:hypothetical protein [Halogeometricum borinquense]ADQ68263.1 hypothetical protein Hbor_27170 [Halogeometricum borinquense DSM 11551]ELY24694.1 hypothetical protein C499_14880 [Halogeometricum borinquense DSM 11551]RYJ12845.1 hypothetical protein ELS19_01895 [Halogeometricum borinquense]